jgi:hypothetical protein
MSEPMKRHAMGEAFLAFENEMNKGKQIFQLLSIFLVLKHKTKNFSH